MKVLGGVEIVQLGFTSVKGMRHVARDEVLLDEHGPVGDREFCLVDVGRRRVLRTERHRSLIGVLARRQGDELEVELPSGDTASGPAVPNGESVTCDYWGRSVAHQLTTGPHSVLLSDYLDKPVRLAASPRGGVVYGAPVSLITTASLRDLAERTGRDDLLETASRFRMTMVVDSGEEPYAEDQWCGREVRVGDVVLAVNTPIPRCAVVNLDPRTGEHDGALLKALADYRPDTGGEPWFGVDARVVRPGTLRLGG